VANVPLLPPDTHGGCPQPQGFGDAIVLARARRNLVTLAHSNKHIFYFFIVWGWANIYRLAQK